jgi:hypothetical protein
MRIAGVENFMNREGCFAYQKDRGVLDQAPDVSAGKVAGWPDDEDVVLVDYRHSNQQRHAVPGSDSLTGCECQRNQMAIARLNGAVYIPQLVVPKKYATVFTVRYRRVNCEEVTEHYELQLRGQAQLWVESVASRVQLLVTASKR